LKNSSRSKTVASWLSWSSEDRVRVKCLHSVGRELQGLY